MNMKILIVDDHPLVCQAITQAVVENGFTSVGDTPDGVEALRMIQDLQPDIVILDIGLEKLDGLAVLRRISQKKLNTRVLVYTAQLKETYATRCLQAGASGFVGKSESIAKLVKAIKTVAEGYLFFPKDALPFPSVMSDNVLDELTDREIQVLKLLTEGLSNRAIAEKLCLSHKTVSGYKITILNKLSVPSVVELVDIARRHGLIA